MPRIRAGALVFLSLLSFLPSPSVAAPALTFGASEVILAGATPEGEVLWFSVERVPTGYYVSVDIRRESTRADASGVASIQFEEEVPTRSVWAAVDLTTGDLALGSPSRGGLLEDPFAPGAFRTDAEGRADQLRHDHKLVEAFWVRPGERSGNAGAWRLRVADGGRHDADGQFDGSVTVRPASLEAAGAEKAPPERFAPGDVVVLIDPTTLEISAARLEKDRGKAGGAR